MSNYISHHGVDGQKHGVRRCQNEDGSLTEEGRKHYGVGPPRNEKTNFEEHEKYFSKEAERERRREERRIKKEEASIRRNESLSKTLGVASIGSLVVAGKNLVNGNKDKAIKWAFTGGLAYLGKYYVDQKY